MRRPPLHLRQRGRKVRPGPGPRILRSALGLAVLGLALMPLAVLGIERGEELAGEHESAKPALSAPGGIEPKRAPAGAEQDRPTLKLPDVVIQGDRQYRVTAERRDLLLMDPMWGTKEIPADMTKVAVPGLNEEKDAPAADTVTAKNFIFSLETGGGIPALGSAELITGIEFPDLNVVLRSDYFAGERPLAFYFTPFDQGGTADLEAGVAAIPGVRLEAGASFQAESNRQPDLNSPWNQWLERANGVVRAGAEIEFAAQSKLKVSGNLGKFFQQGVHPAVIGPLLESQSGELQASFEQDVSGLTREDLNVYVSFQVKSQKAQFVTWPAWNDQEYLHKLQARLRFRPVSVILLDLGVRMDDFRGPASYSTADVVGQASLQLPTGTVIYGAIDAGLEWQLVSEWAFQHPRQELFWLPEPERLLGHYRVGWRQRFGENLSLHALGFRRDARRTPAWVDPEANLLFTLVNLPETRVDGGRLEAEIRYLPGLSQTLAYTYRQAEAGPDRKIPNLPQHAFKTELGLEGTGFSVSVVYRYLGARYGDPAEIEPGLPAAHLLGARGDAQLAPWLDIFLSLDNILNYTWYEWRGYKGRALSILAGLRLTL